MKIKPEMFVRTKHRNEVVIRQVKNIFETSEHDHQLVFDKPTKYQYYVEDNNFIVKEKLIDLIEVGDYVNGCKVMGFNIVSYPYYFDDNGEYTTIERTEDIKSIVTKEKFEREKYMVGE